MLDKLRLTAFLAGLGLVAGCGKPSGSGGDLRTYDAKGIVVQEPAGKTIIIKHEAVSNYMGAMTMPFEAADTNELRGLQAGDSIAFRLNVTAERGWIDHIVKLNTAPQTTPAKEAVHFGPAADTLEVGDLLPDFHFTNELGQAIDLRQYRGQTLAFTFFFTSCPFPNFCPRMTANFSETAEKLSHAPNAPTRWHLFSVSFDTSKDNPEHLKEYAVEHHYDAGHWSFLTGDARTISQFAELFDERYWNEGQSIGHNLRTVVIDSKGRVEKVLEGSNWTSDELAAAMTHG